MSLRYIRSPAPAHAEMRMAIGIAIRFEPVIEIACDIEVLKTNQRQSPCQGMGDLRVLSLAKLARAFAVEVYV